MKRPFWYLRRGRARVGAEVDEELNVHLEMRVAELCARGMPLDKARREAIRQFGDLEETRRYCRLQDQRKENRMRLGLMLGDLWQDLRISMRGLLRVPMMTMTIIVTVGLGIGATTTIFSAVRAALIRPLPYAEPDRLYRIYTDAPPFQWRFSVADYLALEAQQTKFEQIAQFTPRSMSWTDGSAAELLQGRAVSWTYFSLLGVLPVRGRAFVQGDGRPDAPPVVMVSHGFWRSRLGGREDVINKPLRLDGADYTLVGILPPAVGPLEQRQDFFIAAQFRTPPRKGPFFYTVIARLRNGVDPASASEELRAINKRIFPIWKASYQDDKATWSMDSLQTYVVGKVGATAGIALFAVGLVWLMACANASNLLVARVTSRRRELAVRAALGASRSRVRRHLLAESAILAVGAIAIGLVLVRIGVGLLQGVGAIYFPRTQEIALDGTVLLVMAGLALTSGLLFGLIPSLGVTAGSLDQSLRSAGRSATGSRAVHRLRRTLVASQFAIATPLLVIAGLLLVSLIKLSHVDLGFDGRNMLTGSIRLPAAYQPAPNTPGPGRADVFWNDLRERVAALPGVTGVTYADGRPPAGAGNRNNFDLEESPTPPGQSQPITPWVAVTPDYFTVFGLRLLEGRLLDDTDVRRQDLETIVVDRAWARRFFPNSSAVGKRLREGGCTNCPWTTVVGVVSEVKYIGLDEPDQGTVYYALSGSLSRFIMVKADRDPSTLVAGLRRAIQETDAAAPLSSVFTMDELVARSLQGQQSLSSLVASFAAIALILSIVGIYGVMSYHVQQSSKDISIRMALGGSSTDVLRLILGQAMRVVAGGVGVGLLAAYGVAQLMSALLFGVGSSDVTTFAAVSMLMIVVALLACLVPARRALGVQPAQVLRNE